MSPTAAWFLYSMVVANLLGLAAVAGESALRGSGRPGRWAWVVALIASLVLPLMAWSGLSLRSVPSMPESVMIPLAPMALPQLETVVQSAPDLGDALRWIWIVGSLATLSFAILSWLSVRRERRTWRLRQVDGVRVMVTRDRGPAVYGLRRAEILLPEWALRLESRVRRLMLLHEGEHARAGDTRLVVIGLGAVAVAPWNLPLWWQLRRLREAIELDCDARVLRRAPDARRYGALLLEVGRRRSAPVLGVALAEPISLLERRIRLITARAKSASLQRVASLGGLAVLLVAVAVCTRDPMAPVSVLAGNDAVESVVATQSLNGPTFTPFTVPPRLLNRDEIEQVLEANYPPLLKAAGTGGTVQLWFHIDETGVVQQTLLASGSGHTSLDEAALRVASRLRFAPALNRDQPARVWVSLPLRFVPGAAAGEDQAPVAATRQASPPNAARDDAGAGLGGVEAELTSALRESAKAAPVEATRIAEPASVRPDLQLDLRVPVPELATDNVVSMPAPPPAEERRPGFTQFTTPPHLVNLKDAGRAMEREYPVLLRTSGVGGTVKVWFNIDEQGRVQDTVVGETSGFAGLDEAALRVARVMVFEPAMNGAEPVAAWVSLPIKFSTR
jgi:TonB family protein